MSMRDNDELRDRIRALEALVRDMYAHYSGPAPFTSAEVSAYLDMDESIDERMKELGVELEKI